MLSLRKTIFNLERNNIDKQWYYFMKDHRITAETIQKGIRIHALHDTVQC